MRRFFAKLLLLIVLCAGLLLAGSRAYLVCLNTDYIRYRNETLKYESVPEGVEVAAFGSSHSGASLLTDRLPGKTGFNFYSASQSAVMSGAYYNLYRDHFAPNARIYLAISPSTLYCDDTGNLTNVKRYCDSMPVAALPTVKMKLYRLFRLYDFQMSDVLEYFRTKDITDFTGAETNDILAGRVTEIDTASRDWAVWGRQLAEGNLRSIGSQYEKGTRPTVDAALRRILSDCAERGYTVVLYTPPYTAEYRAGYPEAFFRAMERDAGALAAAYGVPYWNYAADERIALDHANFSDVDHLSQMGAERFMSILLADASAFYGE